MLSLRASLFTSYAALLIITLGAFVITFFLAISAYPAPPQATYQQLASIAQGLDITSLLEDYQQQNNSGDANTTQQPRPQPPANPPQAQNNPLLPRNDNQNQAIIIRLVTVQELLDNFAENREVRVLAVRISANRNESGLVIYDSSKELERGDTLPVRMDNYRGVASQRSFFLQAEWLFGSFMEDGKEWLFSGIGGIGVSDQNATILVATERPTQSLQGALSEFNTALVPPLLQAGAFGLVVAVILAFFITRTIAHPLQAAAAAARAVAEGDLRQTVAVTGPPEVKDVANAFNLMSAEVLATQQAQRDFMANVSHDLKTPLTSIQGYSQAIMDGAAKNPTRAAEIIYDEATRLNRMVIDLTDLAQIQSGQFSMNLSLVDVGQVATTVANSLHVIAENKGVNLVNHTPTMPPVSADGDRLVQILNNLIGNAIKFTPKGGEVHISTRQNMNGVEIIVQDTGIGIPKDELPRIFERFYQVDKARGPKRGTGLGLAIAYQIVQAHRGRMQVQSEAGQGTTFAVWLPMA